MKKLNGTFSLAALLVLGHLVSAQNAFAVATLQFTAAGTGGAGFASCADGALCDANPLAGVVTFVGSVGGFAVNVSTGISKPIFAQPQMDLNSVNVQIGAGANTLDIEFSDDNFTVGSPAFSLDFGGTISPSTSSVTATAWYDEGNALFGTTSLIGSLGPFSTGAFSGSTAGPGTLATPFSLTQKLSISTNGPTSFSGDFALNPVPEPDSVALAIGILVLSGTALSRKIKGTQQS